jgi:3-oxoacyl-[acyl-carrier protein] reductase
MPKFPSSHVALITGASTGIGAATAAAFAAEGAQVAVHYNSSEDAAKKVAAGIESSGGKAWLFQADLSKAAACRRLVEDVLKTCGRIDTLVNNAGSLLDRKTLLEITEEFWQQVIDLNFSSAFWMTQAVAPHMIERGSGAIVNVSSVAGRNGGGGGATHYAAAKGAVTTMTKGYAKELIAHGIRVNAVNPGVILTPFHERFSSPERMKAMVSTIPQGRAGKPEEIAGPIVFLAGDAASYIVGESLEINGGMLME